MKPNVGPFNFLTPDREDAFREAILGCNKRHKEYDKNVQHIFDRIPGKDKAYQTRSWAMGYFDEGLSFDEGAKRRSFNGTIGYMFDKIHFVHFKKLLTLD